MKTTYSALFRKTGWMRYISHLDLLRLFNRVLRRAGFKLYLSKGFNPRPVIRIKKALKLGIEGKDLEVEFLLEENMDPLNFKERFNKQLPEGVEIVEIEKR
jgi:radical SAM-linked protein